MRSMEFYPPLFLDILKEAAGEVSIKEIAKKAGCSETTAEANLRKLRGEGLATREWKYGMWMHSEP